MNCEWYSQCQAISSIRILYTNILEGLVQLDRQEWSQQLPKFSTHHERPRRPVMPCTRRKYPCHRSREKHLWTMMIVATLIGLLYVRHTGFRSIIVNSLAWKVRLQPGIELLYLDAISTVICFYSCLKKCWASNVHDNKGGVSLNI